MLRSGMLVSMKLEASCVFYAQSSNSKIELTDNRLTYFLILTDIPEWLQIYSQAPSGLDSKLRWELFRLPELDCFDSMLKRLFRHELERVVMSYEVLR